ncbi:MAG: outer membrane protein assembly factor BamD [Ignavibacteria bacterium]|nr:outer membrane protein assembly factor BamD [Ignavibacteria bacterium]
MNGLKLLNFIFLLTAIFIFGCSSADKSSIKTDDPETAFKIAKLNYDKKDYVQAVEDFSFIKIKFSGTSIIDKAQFYLGMSYYRREEYILAAYEFENLIKNYSSSPYIIEARFYLAMSYYGLAPKYYLDQTYTKYAIIEFQNFLVLFPGDKLIPQAEAKIKELRNRLAFKDLKAAELYMTMENYKAALVYYDNILNEYFDTDYADDASYGRIKVLIIKKMYDDAKKEIERFEKKYKPSEFYNSVKKLKTGI